MLDLPAVRTDLDDAIRQAIDAKTKPPGSLGAVEALAARVASIQGTLTPRLRSCRLTLFAGDHGIASEGVSAYPQAVTRQMVANFLAGGAAANVFARTNGVEIEVVDAGVAGEPLDAPGLVSAPNRTRHPQLRGRAGNDGGAVRGGASLRRGAR